MGHDQGEDSDHKPDLGLHGHPSSISRQKVTHEFGIDLAAGGTSLPASYFDLAFLKTCAKTLIANIRLSQRYQDDVVPMTAVANAQFFAGG
jgi:hypothetical protein